MNQFLSDYKAKILSDLRLFFDYWYVWVGVLVLLVGFYLLFVYLKGGTDEN